MEPSAVLTRCELCFLFSLTACMFLHSRHSANLELQSQYVYCRLAYIAFPGGLEGCIAVKTLNKGLLLL